MEIGSFSRAIVTSAGGRRGRSEWAGFAIHNDVIDGPSPRVSLPRARQRMIRGSKQPRGMAEAEYPTDQRLPRCVVGVVDPFWVGAFVAITGDPPSSTSVSWSSPLPSPAWPSRRASPRSSPRSAPTMRPRRCRQHPSTLQPHPRPNRPFMPAATRPRRQVPVRRGPTVPPRPPQ